MARRSSSLLFASALLMSFIANSAANAQTHCAIEAAAGTYRTQHGDLICRPGGGGLDCCYGEQCQGTMGLRRARNPLLVTGEWVDPQTRTQGEVTFTVGPDCSLTSGSYRLRNNFHGSAGWLVFGRLSSGASTEGRRTKLTLPGTYSAADPKSNGARRLVSEAGLEVFGFGIGCRVHVISPDIDVFFEDVNRPRLERSLKAIWQQAEERCAWRDPALRRIYVTGLFGEPALSGSPIYPTVYMGIFMPRLSPAGTEERFTLADDPALDVNRLRPDGPRARINADDDRDIDRPSRGLLYLTLHDFERHRRDGHPPVPVRIVAHWDHVRDTRRMQDRGSLPSGIEEAVTTRSVTLRDKVRQLAEHCFGGLNKGSPCIAMLTPSRVPDFLIMAWQTSGVLPRELLIYDENGTRVPPP